MSSVYRNSGSTIGFGPRNCQTNAAAAAAAAAAAVYF